MRIPRIYQDCELTLASEIELDESGARHVVQVLRLKPAAELVLFNGDGNDYAAQLLEAGKRQVRVRISDRRTNHSESMLQVHLALGISRGERMDYALQKSVELGVNVITPLLAERCVVQLDERRALKRQQHWQGIIQSAAEQCGRSRLPQLNPVQPLTAFLERSDLLPALSLDPASSLDLGACPPPPDNRLTLLIGPEGGFAPVERKLTGRHGVTGVRLGPRILRTETAVVAGLTALQMVWGDLSGARG